MFDSFGPKPISRGDILVFPNRLDRGIPPVILCHKPLDIRANRWGGTFGMLLVEWGSAETCHYPAFDSREYSSSFEHPGYKIVVLISQRPKTKAVSRFLFPESFITAGG